MKRAVLALPLLLACGAVSFAQQLGPNEAVTAHYDVTSSAGQQDAQAVANELEAFFGLFNSYFHFDPSSLSYKLAVRIFQSKKEFDGYLSGIVPGTRGTFVFLQYQDPTRSELVGFHQQPDDSTFTVSLLHHGFVQFLRSFVSQPPLWLQEGFAVYFESSEYDATKGDAIFHPNLGWVPTLKDAANRYLSTKDSSAIIPLASLLSMDASGANAELSSFYPESWALVSFLEESDQKAYNRVLWDAISSLGPSSTVAENSAAIQKRAFSWISETQLGSDFAAYIQSVKTFPELIADGTQAYASGDLARAAKDFDGAIALDEKSDVPYYYLGLIKYAGRDYYQAEHYFQAALQAGGDPGLVNYALGINAYADNRIDDAKTFLGLALASNSPDYKDKASFLLSQIAKQSAQ